MSLQKNNNYYGLLSPSLPNVIWYLFHNSAGAFSVQVKVLSTDFSTDFSGTRQNPCGGAPLR